MVQLRPNLTFHLIGIGGAGLSALATVLHEAGYAVSGCDRSPSPFVDSLRALGVPVHLGHDPAHVQYAGVVVRSSAVPPDHPEVRAAEELGRPVVKREAVIGALMADRMGIAVAGTHGKTTTTAMLAWIAMAAGRDPSFIVGGLIRGLNRNARAGRGDLFIVEADEYDRMFLGLRPRIAVVTTIEHDHPDCYPTPEAFFDAFVTFVERVPSDGILVACDADPGARRLADRVEAHGRAVMRYGWGPPALWWARPMAVDRFEIYRGDQPIGELTLQVPGHHHGLNALAALAVAEAVGIPPANALEALGRFPGTARRFEVKGEAQGVLVIDDYAHHPGEIRATLRAARARYPRRPIWAVFQPHTYSRTRALLKEFAQAFEDADHVILTPIYAARETDTLGVSSQDIVQQMIHPDARHFPDFDTAIAYLKEHIRPGDVVLTLGAGDGYRIGERLLDLLGQSGEGR
ncbi:UDP-N-acetylmuramate--L-alanine ligase [Thermoflexus sp.]|nr:UDP-N-acetylmuramate--L-alanine ligase [Thermoflexus sp.]MCS6963190.1 UDP-N-acetylmuramate--L-alanine ligase [Thermoflexus sp.]MCX7689672.1 UDP-N-acetylmuramate--L-alanine ligase [Thermoflexus sp.]MDW8065312.1 UDP-N-acetylmuramate--L-alanine ligase [Anaerolineae bacterium]MDW8184466.1 UDP-N-acetylmuramate--L-alanine ligase [Anaerolineae bacterium]